MKKRTVVLALSAAILVSAVIIGVIYEMGLTSQDLPFDDSGPTPAPLPQPEMAVSATYSESAETVRIRVESGRMTAEEYDILEISQRGHEYDVNDTKLKLPGQTEVHPSGKWVDTESRGLTSFPVMAGDSIIVVTVDRTDDDGDGIEGIDGNDSFLLGYGHRRGLKHKAILASWTVDNGTLTRGNKFG